MSRKKVLFLAALADIFMLTIFSYAFYQIGHLNGYEKAVKDCQVINQNINK